MNKKSILTLGIASTIVCTGASIVSIATLEGVVTASILNVRSGASTKNNVLFKLNKNTKILILETKNGWHKIKYNGKEGWVSSSYIEIKNNSSNNTVDSNITSTTQKQTTTSVNLRTGPSTSYAKITTLARGVNVKYLSKSGDWDKVEHNGKTGYIMSKYLKNISSNTNSSSNTSSTSTSNYKVNVDTLNIRDKASTNGNILGKLYKDKIISVSSISNGWATFSYNNKIAYVSAQYLTKVSSSTSNNTENNNTSSQPTTPSEQKNYLSHQYKELDNKESIQLTSTSEIKYTHFFLSNPNRLVLDISNAQLEKNILDEAINKKFIKKYRANYDANTNTTRVVIEFGEEFDKNKVKISKSNNILNIIYDELIQENKPSEQKNYLSHQYKELDNKESIQLTSTSEIKYTHFFLSNPNRLVLDISNAQLEKNILDEAINKKFIKKYRANYDANTNTTRVVIEFGEEFDKNKVKINQIYTLTNIIYDQIIEENESKPNLPTNYPNVILSSINKSFDDYIKSQEGRYAIISKNGILTKATIDEVRQYANPHRESLDNRNYKFQFLSLDSFRNINISGLNAYLSTLKPLNNNINIFFNKGQAFADSCKKYNIDPLYFVAHTLLETGNGGSVLAQGNEVELDTLGNAKRYHYKDSNGRLCYYVNGTITPDNGNLTDAQKKSPVMFVKLKDANTPKETKTIKVYNLFGIGAVDGVPVQAGTTKAYDEGWTTIEKAIDGGAAWISSNYINSTKYTHQNTLYSMKWDYVYGWHQYSTDVGWPIKIATSVNKLSYLYSNGDNDLKFIFPKYK